MLKNFSATFIPYQQTGYFTKIVSDYISQSPFLKDFIASPVDEKNILSAIEKRKIFKTDRKLLVAELSKQYKGVGVSQKVNDNIQQLLNENTFTICTAHQPNIFTGHLYFIYKIVHVIKITADLQQKFPGNNFVPVFYMGSEDADLEELNHVHINGKKHEWKTAQTGAVGRMIIDDAFLHLIQNISGQLVVEPFGNEIIELVKSSYSKGSSIEQATFKFVNSLFANYGLVILLPDNPVFKNTMSKIFEDDILDNAPSEIVNKTSQQLQKQYKVQAHPREINLFYLKDNIRQRIVKGSEKFHVLNTDIEFTQQEILAELQQHPERFSPNVILRGLYQETILPNIAFVGGGGEVAYWLELKDLFDHYQVPFPMLIIRNSFLIIEENYKELIHKIGINDQDVFKTENDLLTKIVQTQTLNKISLEEEKNQLADLYKKINKNLQEVDVTLQQHTQALQAKALRTITSLEKKILRAEKLKYDAQKRQLQKLLANLFPNNSLQERVDNFMPYYAKWGSDFIEIIYDNSLTFQQQFCILQQN